jgi:hypothetical protein
MNKPRDLPTTPTQRRNRKRGCLLAGGILFFLCLVAVLIIPFTPAMGLLRKVKRGLVEIVHGGGPKEKPSPPPPPSEGGDNEGGTSTGGTPPPESLDPQVIVKEVLVKPSPPERFVSYRSVDTAELWSDFEVKSEFNVAKGKTATIERKDRDSFTIEMKVNVRVPEANDSLEALAGLNPDLPKVLPGLKAMMGTAKVSPFYNQIYKNKVTRMQSNLTRLNRLLTRHNFFDCETILELTYPETKKRVLLLQGEMDVVSDGSDGDRAPEYDEYIAKSDYYQPFTSYGWAKRTQQPNPLLARWEKKLKDSQAASKPSASTIAEIKREIADLKARSFLIARADPFIVIPISMLGYTGRPGYTHAPSIGDYAVVIYKDKVYPAIAGDGGPSFQTGEASLRIAKEINAKATPYVRPESDLKITYLVFPGTAEKPFGPPDLVRWRERCAESLAQIGGLGEEIVLHEWVDYFKKDDVPAEGEAPPPPPPAESGAP